MIEDFIEIREAMKLLGYSDYRSIKKWCTTNNIPVASLGIKKYISKHLLTQHIENQIVIFVQEKPKDAGLDKIEDVNHSFENKSEYNNHSEHSQAATRFLDKIKRYEKGSRKI